MQTFRKIIAPLLVIPVGYLVYALVTPDWQSTHPEMEFGFILIGIPIILLNLAAWFQPEVFEYFFPKKAATDGQDSTEKSDTSSKRQPGRFTLIFNNWHYSAIVLGVFVLSILFGVFITPSGGIRPNHATLAAEKATQIALGTPFPSLMPQSTLIAALTPRVTPALTAKATSNGLTLLATATTAEITPTATIAITQIAGVCYPASQDLQASIFSVVNSANSGNTIGSGWMVKSTAADNLWFFAAKIYGSGITTTTPGVWAMFVYPTQSFTIFSVNDIAATYSQVASGQTSTPATSMTSSGAQTVYDCAAAGN